MIDLSGGLRSAVIEMDENVGAAIGNLYDLFGKLEGRVSSVEDAFFGPLVQATPLVNQAPTSNGKHIKNTKGSR